MTEAQLQSVVIDAARLLGWGVTHFRPAMTSKGWRTPVSGDGVGFPDLILVRADQNGGRVAFAELKSDRGRLSPAQERWIERLEKMEIIETYVWRPKDWVDGTIERILRQAKAAA